MSGTPPTSSPPAPTRPPPTRFLLQDAIPSRSRLVVTFQHGPYDNTTGTSASALAYYYQRPAARAQLTDMLNVGIQGSEKAHHYLVTGPQWDGTGTYTYAYAYAYAGTASITDTGRG